MTEGVDSIFKEHSDEIFGYLCRYCGNRALAEDILSDVFVRLVEEIKKADRVEPVQWRPWLYRVATNLAISHFRRQKVRDLFSIKSRSREVGEDESSAKLEARQMAEKVRDIIEGLSAKLKSVIIMSAYQELSYEETAAALEINIGTVKSRLCEAKRLIKEKLEG